MIKGNLPKRFLTLRDKDRNGASHRRSKSSEPGHRNRSFNPDNFFSIFRPNVDTAAKQAARAKEEEEKEMLKIEEISRWVGEEKLTDITHDHVRYAVQSKYSDGNVEKAKELLRLHHDAFEGKLLPYNANIPMLGAENRGAVTCYLDALLFAMFAKIEAFECMLLRKEYADEAHRNLAALLRLWVNMLRSGKLIRVDMTEHIQNALAACGWSDAKLLEQQDTSEAFAFITETLQLPLLTLQVDLFHQGKGDVDDHKVVFERLLNLAVPADPEGKGIKLEDCLEEYFNTRVDVLRDSLDEKKSADRYLERIADRNAATNGDILVESPVDVTSPRSTTSPRNTIRVVTDVDDEDESHDWVENLTLLQRRWTTLDSPASSSSTPTRETRPDVRPRSRTRSTSIIQRVVLDAEGKPTDADDSSLLQKVKRQGSTVVKAVTIPAWQFFKLIPWHSASKDEPLNDTDVAKHLNKRPVVGICLKRYMMTEAGKPIRHNTFIDIPDSLRLPHFMLLDDTTAEESNGLSSEYKLVLQSVVCHRGDSLHSGHYISFSRVAPKLLTDNRRHDTDPPPDYEDAQWVRFDDLLETRVTYVDDIKRALREEMPYLLFYQIMPMVDVTAASVDGTETEPPSYNDSTVNIANAGSNSPTTTDSERPGMSRQASGYFDSTTLTYSTGPSIRFSSELERPLRLSIDNDPYQNPNHLVRANPSRRGSVPFSESSSGAPEVASPAVTPNEESTAQRLSRAAARFTKAKDKEIQKEKDKENHKEKEKEKDRDKDKERGRPSSQTGEGRMSLTMSRLGGLMRTSKEPLREAEGPYESDLASSQHIESTLATTDAPQQPKENDKWDQLLNGKDKDKEKKDRGKSKNRGDKEPKEKDKEKRKTHHHHHRKTGSNGGEPERECVVM